MVSRWDSPLEQALGHGLLEAGVWMEEIRACTWLTLKATMDLNEEVGS